MRPRLIRGVRMEMRHAKAIPLHQKKLGADVGIVKQVVAGMNTQANSMNVHINLMNLEVPDMNHHVADIMRHVKNMNRELF